jgi:hypothetical protein
LDNDAEYDEDNGVMRRHRLYDCGIISFTYRHSSAPGKSNHGPGQLQQVNCSERCTAGSYPPELVFGLDICPSRSDPVKPTALVRIKDPVLAPMPASVDQLDLAAMEGMKRVRDSNLSGRRRSHTTCI